MLQYCCIEVVGNLISCAKFVGSLISVPTDHVDEYLTYVLCCLLPCYPINIILCVHVCLKVGFSIIYMRGAAICNYLIFCIILNAGFSFSEYVSFKLFPIYVCVFKHKL
jgi:hypothetical protein